MSEHVFSKNSQFTFSLIDILKALSTYTYIYTYGSLQYKDFMIQLSYYELVLSNT